MSKTKIKLIFPVILFFVFFGLVKISNAAPNVTGVNGIVTHGQSVTIYGSSFGTKSPAAPAFWDNGMAYTGLTNGSIIPTPESSGTNPYGWDGFSGENPVYYKTSNPRGVWTPHYSNQWSPNGYLQAAMGDSGIVIPGVSTTKQLYLTWWVYLYGDPTIGGTNTANKYYRLLSGEGTWGNDGNGTIMWGPNGSFSSFAFTGSQYLPSENFASPIVSYPGWNRMETWVDSSSTAHDPSHVPNYTCGVNGSVSSAYTSTPTQSWTINTLSALGADWDSSSGEPVMDWGEIYADDTFSRIEICSSSTWAARSHCEIQIPSGWSNTAATVTVNRGSFGSSSSAYLYVVDATNTANANGYPVTFGSGSSDTTPPASPTGLSVS